MVNTLQSNITTLGNVAKYINGRAFKPSEWEETGLPIIRIQNLTDKKAKYNYTSLKHDDKFLVKNGDLLFAWSASLGAHIWQGNEAWLNQHIFKVLPYECIEKSYLYYFLCRVVSELYTKTHGSGMVHITKNMFINTPIPVPPIQDQKRIVARIEELFSNLDSAVETLQKTKQQLEVYRQAVLREAFSEFDSNTYIILKNIIEKPRYGTSKKCTYDQTDNSISVYRIPNIDYRLGCIDTTDLKYADFTNEELKKIDLQTNDLLMIRSNGSVSLVGRTAIVSQANNNDTFAGYLIRLRFINPSIYRAKFLHYYLQSHNARIYIENVAKSTSGVNNINSDEISKIPIPWGDDDRIKHVVCNIDRYLSISNNICNTVDEALHQAEAMRQSILKQAFEGEYKFARV